MSDLTKTIIHEAGHFFAMECHNKLDKRFDTDNITIVKKGEKHEGRFNPRICIEKSNDLKIPIQRLSPFVLRIISGCVFESIYLKNNFAYCFNDNSNGRCDYNELLYQFNLYKINLITINPIINKYISKLKESTIIENFQSKIDNKDLLNPVDEITFDVNLKKLRALFDQNIYSEIYTETLAELENTLNLQK